jgi:hypothetical protein
MEMGIPILKALILAQITGPPRPHLLFPELACPAAESRTNHAKIRGWQQVLMQGMASSLHSP